jgi:hypothetical protein
MRTFTQILVVILQVIAASLLGFSGAILLGAGNGWELLVFAVGYSLGVWGVGALAAKLRKDFTAREQGWRLLSALACSALGVGLLLVTPPIGFVKAVYPLLGALLGYYLPGLVARTGTRKS